MQLVKLRHPVTGKTWAGVQVDANELKKRGWVDLDALPKPAAVTVAEAPRSEPAAFTSEAHVEDTATVQIEPAAAGESGPEPQKEEKKKRKYIRNSWR